jgi:hypothetical protein
MVDIIRRLPGLRQRQYSLQDQLTYLVQVAFRLGLYDAADFIRKSQGWI